MGRTFATTDTGNAGSSATLDSLGASAFSMIFLIRRGTTDAGNQVIACKPFAGATGWTFLLDEVSGGGTFGCLRMRVTRATTNTDFIANAAGAIAQSTTQWVAVSYDPSGTPQCRIFKAGLTGAFTEVAYSLSQAGAGSYNADDAANLFVGNSSGATTPFSGNIYTGAIFPSVMTAAQCENWRDGQRPVMNSPTCWWRFGLVDPEADESGNGITLDITGTTVVGDVETPYVITSGQIADTETPSDQTTHIRASTASRVRYVLSGAADTVDVALYNTYDSGVFEGQAAVGVWRSVGAATPTYLGSISAPSGGAGADRGTLASLSLAAGEFVTILAGCRQTTGPTGTWPITARFSSSGSPVAATVVTPGTPDKRVCIIGYSTLMSSATPEHELAWTMLYRLQPNNENRVFMDQKGGLSLFNEGPNAAARTTYANRLAAFNANLYFMGHGDFVTDQQSAADYQTALQDLCEKLLSAAPLAKVCLYTVHILQTSDETVPNSFGDVVQDYRDAEIAVVGAINNRRLTYTDTTTLVGWVNATDTTDGRHPNDGGHAKLFAFYAPTITDLLLPGAGFAGGGDLGRRRI